MPSKPHAPVKKSPAKPAFFTEPAQFRAWLVKRHATAPELLVGFYRRDSGKPSMTWPESVDQALCFGWIDGVRRRLDQVSYTIRFTPRRAGSNWSAINIRRVKALQAEGLMHAAGLTAFAKRSDDKSRIYFYEQRHTARLDPEHQKKLEANRKAWAFFQAQPPGYQRLMAFWVVSAKKEKTRLKRLQRLIDQSARGRRLV
ncbi:MAG TPA: YdeI/OmpD-associated family protein [Gemmatimonadales bacterium]|nr:YdeI/OmpD-associated family protein [Gemmatimonadales bacterium]